MDAGRKDATTKVKEGVTPQSSKSTTDKITEGLTNTTDKVGREAVPDSEKSTGQSVLDKTGREKDHNKPAQGESMIDKALHAVGMDTK